MATHDWLRVGSRGSEVTELQQWMKDNGYDPGPIDGIFGPKTAKAVRAFQSAAGIQVDAIVGPETRGAMGIGGGTGDGGLPIGGVGVDTSPAGKPSGSSSISEGVVSGGQLMKIERPGATDLWMQVYEWPSGSGKFIAFQYDSVDQLTQVFGPRWWEKTSVQVKSESYLDNNIHVMDDASGIIGTPGHFGTLMQETMTEAAKAAGINDPTIIGMIAGNAEWQAIAATAVLGGWTEEQMDAELRQTDLWQNTLFPGIASFYGETSEPERAWNDYQQTVAASLEALGYDRDDDGSYRSVIGEMLTKGVSENAFVENASVFIRAENSAEFHDALNVWTQRELGRDASFDEWFDVLADTSSTEMADVAELATLQFASDQTGLAVSEAQLRRLAGNLNLSEAEAFSAFNETERSLLAIGDENLTRYGLSQADLVAASAGISPESGRSIEEVRLQARKAATEMALSDDVKSQLFVGYTEEGTPERPGLKALAPEGA